MPKTPDHEGKDRLTVPFLVCTPFCDGQHLMSLFVGEQAHNKKILVIIFAMRLGQPNSIISLPYYKKRRAIDRHRKGRMIGVSFVQDNRFYLSSKKYPK